MRSMSIHLDKLFSNPCAVAVHVHLLVSYWRLALFEIKNAHFNPLFDAIAFEELDFSLIDFHSPNSIINLYFQRSSQSFNKKIIEFMIIHCTEKKSLHTPHRFIPYSTKLLRNEVCQIYFRINLTSNLPSIFAEYIAALNNNVRIRSLPHRRATIPIIL